MKELLYIDLQNQQHFSDIGMLPLKPDFPRASNVLRPALVQIIKASRFSRSFCMIQCRGGMRTKQKLPDWLTSQVSYLLFLCSYIGINMHARDIDLSFGHFCPTCGATIAMMVLQLLDDNLFLLQFDISPCAI